MNSFEKLCAIFWCCLASVLITLISCTFYYNYSVDTAAVKAGLVQERNGSHIIWVKPLAEAKP